MADDDIPKGVGYRFLYDQPNELTSDSTRMRRRLLSLVTHSLNEPQRNSFSRLIESTTGSDAPHNFGFARYESSWREFFLRASIADLLTSVTLFLNFLKAEGYKDKSTKLRSDIQEIFEQERVRYTLDSYGGVHPMIDTAYERTLALVLRSLRGQRYKAANTYIEAIDEALLKTPPNPTLALRHVFDAAENIFKLMFSGQIKLTSATAKSSFEPEIQRVYGVDPTALRAMNKSLLSLCDWIDAMHNYRHEEGKSEPSVPPESGYVLLLSLGLAFVRWLAELDRKVLERNSGASS